MQYAWFFIAAASSRVPVFCKGGKSYGAYNRSDDTINWPDCQEKDCGSFSGSAACPEGRPSKTAPPSRLPKVTHSRFQPMEAQSAPPFSRAWSAK